MGITRGTVMDKVTNIFSSNHSEDKSVMGNSVNKDRSLEKDINGINIPKGAVANGRAKFESQRISPEKPLRFFASRSRPSTPALPVKTPRVPALPSDIIGKINFLMKPNSQKIKVEVMTFTLTAHNSS